MLTALFLLPVASVAHAAVPRATSTLTPFQRAEIRAIREQKPATRLQQPARPQSWFAKLWSTIGSGVLGSLGVVAGSAVAWYTLKKKSKTFNTYYDQIKDAQKRYTEQLASDTVNKATAKANFKKELILIQEEAELTAAKKKLDGEQLTAIVNKIQRMVNEISS